MFLYRCISLFLHFCISVLLYSILYGIAVVTVVRSAQRGLAQDYLYTGRLLWLCRGVLFASAVVRHCKIYTPAAVALKTFVFITFH